MPTLADRHIRKLNPATGQLIADYPVASEAEVEAAVLRARLAQGQWQKISLKKRAHGLKAMRNRLYQQAHKLAEIISRETGKPLGDSLEADIATALNVLSYYAEIGPQRLRPSLIQPDLLSLVTARLHHQTWHPRGVIAIIAPWNFPVAIACSGIAAALMAGNSVVLKPSELTPECGKALIAVVRDALSASGLDPEIAQIVIGDGATGAQLLAQPIDGVIFTGSRRTGQLIAQQAAERDLWCSLELGGSDAMIILEDCDLDKAASYALWGRFINAGQTCAAVKRLLVPARHEAAFLKLLASKMQRLRVGSPDQPDPQVGPLINEAQRTLIHEQVQNAIQQGAQLLQGGHHLPGPGFFYAPTLFTQVPPSARILNEECFGPVLPVIPYDTIEQAVRMANDTPFGLTASVFGPPSQARQVASLLHCGTVVINDVGPTNYALPCAPWGGWKHSGSGVSHGAAALTDLSRLQVLSENLMYGIPFMSKPLWHFGKPAQSTKDRAKTVLALAGRQNALWHPKRWWPFWTHRSATKF
ncbi:aldehyde dehydrogenase [Vampirovibrio sp.]|uniref:aldehyde dehydrogenase family protein n=1 Tax=Vampirovibrio sp. TaxID=2717857 RepID=UPI003593666C